jgi:hypothetical protein
VPSAVYATEADFDRYELTSSLVRERVQRAADEAVRLAVGGYAVGATAQPAAVPALA